MTDDVYEVRYQRPARRALSEDLPEAVAAAAFKVCRGALALNPQRIGVPLHPPLAKHHSARRGTYRVVCSIDERARIVYVEWIDHRSEVYRPR